MFNRRKRKKGRNDVILALSNELINIIYKKDKDRKLKQMAKLANENAYLRNKRYATFVFKNNWYCAPPDLYIDRNYKRVINRKENRHEKILDPSLIHKAEEIMNESYEDQITKARIEDYIKEAVAYSPSIFYLSKIIPGDLLYQVDLSKYYQEHDTDTVLLDDEIKEFKEKNKDRIKQLKKLFIKELITPEED